jgi:hypothetical protein
MGTNSHDPFDDWRGDGPKITDPTTLEVIRHCLETDGPIIVEHWFFYGGRTPDRMIFDEFQEFIAYLDVNARAGDSIHIWNYPNACRNDNELAYGKYPDGEGLVPRGGAY